MLNTLDTVIAFAVIMTVLSLLITIVVQMVSAALSLRGKNLANALALTFQTIDPNLQEQAHSLANQILRDPIFSDSIWRPKERPLRGNAATHAQAKVERAEKDLQLANEQLATRGDPAAIKQATATRDQAQNAFDVAKQALDKCKKDCERRDTHGQGEPYRGLGRFLELARRHCAWKRHPSRRNLSNHPRDCRPDPNRGGDARCLSGVG